MRESLPLLNDPPRAPPPSSLLARPARWIHTIGNRKHANVPYGRGGRPCRSHERHAAQAAEVQSRTDAHDPPGRRVPDIELDGALDRRSVLGSAVRRAGTACTERRARTFNRDRPCPAPNRHVVALAGDPARRRGRRTGSVGDVRDRCLPRRPPRLQRSAERAEAVGPQPRDRRSPWSSVEAAGWFTDHLSP
jgi:hypothetical protein